MAPCHRLVLSFLQRDKKILRNVFKKLACASISALNCITAEKYSLSFLATEVNVSHPQTCAHLPLRIFAPPLRIFAPPLKSHAPPLGKVSMIDQSENLTF
jgi:hypothetical protein